MDKKTKEEILCTVENVTKTLNTEWNCKQQWTSHTLRYGAMLSTGGKNVSKRHNWKRPTQTYYTDLKTAAEDIGIRWTLRNYLSEWYSSSSYSVSELRDVIRHVESHSVICNL